MQKFLNFFKDFKHYKLVLNILVVLIIVGGSGTWFYYQTKVTETCEKKLESYLENHLCISTSKGLMVFELYPNSGPKAVEKMKTLSNDKFYDGLEFYRVVPGFVAQAGIQDTATKLVDNYINDDSLRNKVDKLGKDTFPVETDFDDLGLDDAKKKELVDAGYTSDSNIVGRKFKYGSLSFANNGPQGNSTEFFVVTSKKDNDENLQALEGKFTNFGEIVEGKDVLDKINSAEPDLNYPLEFSSDQSHPAQRIEIFEMRTK